MYGCIPTAPVTPDGDLGVLFLHNEGYSTMCGHGVIGLVKVGLECGLLDAGRDGSEIRLDTPAGRVTARARLRADGGVESVRFRNVPSFVVAEGRREIGGLGPVPYTLAFGGAFYAYVDAAEVGLQLSTQNLGRLIDVGMAIKHELMQAPEIRHPDGGGELDFLYGTILIEPLQGGVHSRNVCIFAQGEVDRSPTGTGVSGRAAIGHARGELALGETLLIESLIGTRFGVTIVGETRVGPLPAVVPEVSGSAWITGRHEFVIEDDDPLRAGILLR